MLGQTNVRRATAIIIGHPAVLGAGAALGIKNRRGDGSKAHGWLQYEQTSLLVQAWQGWAILTQGMKEPNQQWEQKSRLKARRSRIISGNKCLVYS